MKNTYMWNLKYCRTSVLQFKHLFKLKRIALIRPSVYCWGSGHPIFDQGRVDDLRELPSSKAIIGQKHAFLTPYVSIFSEIYGCTSKDCCVVQNVCGMFYHTFKFYHCPDFYSPAMTNQFGVTVRYCSYILFSMSVLVCYICLCFGKECQNHSIVTWDHHSYWIWLKS